MRGCSSRPRSPSISVCKSSPTASTSVTRRGGRTPATNCAWSPRRSRAASASTTPLRCAPAGRRACSASTLGVFLRSFSWGHVRRSTASAASCSPAAGRPTGAVHDRPRFDLRDLRPGEGGRPVTATRACSTPAPDAVLARLQGRANTARGAAHFLRGRWAGSALPERADGARRQPSTTTPSSPSAASRMSVNHSPAAGTRADRGADWTPIPWLGCRRDATRLQPRRMPVRSSSTGSQLAPRELRAPAIAPGS